MTEQGTKLVKTSLEGITVNGAPVTVFIEEEQARETEKHFNNEVASAARGINYVAPASKFGNTSGERSQHRNHTVALSSEIRAHVNYLYEKGGTKAVTEFMSMPQQQKEQGGSIEAALRDAEEKTKFYEAQRSKVDQEIERWGTVATRLREVLGMLNGSMPARHVGAPRGPRQVRIVNGKEYVKLPRGHWVNAVNTILANNRVIPRHLLTEELQATAPETPREVVQSAVTRALAIGQIILTEEGLRLVS